MHKAIYVFQRTSKSNKLLTIVISLMTMVGIASQGQRVWAQPPVPAKTEFPAGERIPCAQPGSPQLFIKTEIVRTPLKQFLVMVITTPPSAGKRASVVTGIYVNSAEAAILTVVFYKILCMEGLFNDNLDSSASLAASLPNQPFKLEFANGVSDVAAADFNNDGIDDLVFANDGADTVSILLGAADLTLGLATAFPAGDGPAAIAVSDLNQDGHVDVVTANTLFPNTDLTVMFGNGDGTLQAPIALASDESPIDVDLGDINVDTVTDIVFTSQTGVSTILSNGDGTFQNPTALENNLFPVSVQLVDMNADGFLDVLSSTAIRLGNGDSTFQLPLPFPTNIFHFYADAGDLNSDGVLDVVAVSSGTNIVTAMLGVGDGTLQPPVHYAVGNGPQYVEIQQTDDDGLPDLVVSNTFDDHVTVLSGNGDGTFIGTPFLPASPGTSGIVIADFTGDSMNDIATGSGLNREVTILPGLEPGRYGEAMIVSNLRGVVTAESDFNRDGHPDLLVVSSGRPGRTHDTVTVAMGSGDGTFGHTTVLQLPDQDRQVNPALALDVNNDSNLDILTANNGTADISVFLGNGDGTFQTANRMALGATSVNQSSFMVQSHFNADANIDLAIVSPGDVSAATGSVSILLGDGTGLYGKPTTVAQY